MIPGQVTRALAAGGGALQPGKDLRSGAIGAWWEVMARGNSRTARIGRSGHAPPAPAAPRPRDMRGVFGSARAPVSEWVLLGRTDVRGMTEDVFDEEGNHTTRSLSGSPRQPVCDHCGARLTKAYLIRNAAGESIAVGSECCREFLGMPGAQAMRALVRAARTRRAEADRERRAQSEQAERLRIAEQAFLADRDVYDHLRARIPVPSGERYPAGHKPILDQFARELGADRLLVLSERQVDLARRLIAEESAQKAAAPATVRVLRREGSAVADLEVTLLRLREDHNRFGPVLKATLREPSGHLVWLQTSAGTKAAALLEGLEAGDGVRIAKATVSGQTEDRGMTFLRRATLAPAA